MALDFLKGLVEDNGKSVGPDTSGNGTMTPINIKPKEVHDVLDKAKEDEEVDTVTFGMETSDGQIVKVYVAVDDSEAFEKELSQKLGSEDSIENVLDELADKYDIVDVQWPEGMSKEDEKESEPEKPKEDEEEVEHTDEELSYGERFRQKLSLKEAESHSRENHLGDHATDDDDNDRGSDGLVMPNRVAELLYKVILELGVPESVINRKRFVFRKAMRDKAIELRSDNRKLSYLKIFARNAFGITMYESEDIPGKLIAELAPIVPVDINDIHTDSKWERMAVGIALAIGIPETILQKDSILRSMGTAVSQMDQEKLSYVLKGIGKQSSDFESEEPPQQTQPTSQPQDNETSSD